MNFLHQDLSIVGNFNTSIIVPTWLKETGIYQGPIEIELNPTTKVMRFYLVKNEIFYQVSESRFVVYPRTPVTGNLDRLKLGFVSGIFNHLKYTPMTAIGFNFHFAISDAQVEKLNQVLEPYKEYKSNIQKGAKPVKDTISRIFSVDDYKVAIVHEIEVGRPPKVLINFEKRLMKNPEKAIESFINRVKEFQKYAIDYAISD